MGVKVLVVYNIIKENVVEEFKIFDNFLIWILIIKYLKLVGLLNFKILYVKIYNIIWLGFNE